MKVAKRLNKALIVVLLLAFALCMAATFLCFNANAIAYAADLSAEDLCELYTDSDNLYESEYTITDYTTLHSNFSMPTYKTFQKWYEMNFTNDDPIVKIIPKQYFEYAGEFLYIGKEYGFYIHSAPMTMGIIVDNLGYPTTYQDVSNKMAIDGNNYVQILVFDISYNLDYQHNLDMLSVSLSNLFQYEYYYVKSTQHYVPLFVNGMETCCLGHYDISTDDMVVAAPKVNMAYMPIFEQTSNLYLKDISIAGTLFNEQEKNQFDTGYDAYADEGQFFTAFDYEFNGAYTEDNGKTFDFEDFLDVLDLVSFASGFISNFLPGPGKAIALAINGVTSTFSFAASLTNLINKFTQDPIVEKSISQNTISSDRYYTTRAEQLQNYVDDRGNPALIKSVGLTLNGYEGHDLWFRPNDYVNAMFTVSQNQDNINDYWQTRFITEIGLRVIDKETGRATAPALGVSKHIIGEDKYKELETDKMYETTLLDDGYNYFEYTPKYTGKYNLTFDMSGNRNLYMAVDNKNGFEQLSETNNKFDLTLQGGHTYYFKLYSPTISNYTFTFAPEDSVYSCEMQPGENRLFRFTSTASRLAKLTSNCNGVDISEVFYSNGKTPDMLLSFTPAESVEFFLEKGKTYNIVLTNNSGSNATANLDFEELNRAAEDGLNFDFVANDNYAYFKFSPEQNDKTYLLYLDGLTDSATQAIKYFVIDSNGAEVNSVEAFGSGYLFLKNLSQGEVYYIGIKANTSFTAVFHLSLEGDAFSIKTYDVTGRYYLSDSANQLYIGNTYRIDLKLGSKTIDANLVVVHDTHSSITLDINSVARTIKINTSRLHKSSFVAKLCVPNTTTEIASKLYETIWDVSEVGPLSVDLVNAINVSWNKPSFVDSIDYTIEYKRPNDSDFRTLDTKNVTGTSVDIMKTLYENNAVSAKFIISTVNIEQLEGNDNVTYHVATNIATEINLYYSREEVEGWLIKRTKYYITNELQLYNIRYDQSFDRTLDNNLYMKKLAPSWTPIPLLDCRLDGNLHSIYDVSINYKNKAFTNLGFIEEIGKNGVLYELSLENLTLEATNPSSSTTVNIGGIAGLNRGSIVFASVSGSIISNSENSRVGGLVGYNLDGSIGFGVATKLDIYGYGDMGGIAGKCEFTYPDSEEHHNHLENSVLTDVKIRSVLGTKAISVGGVVGYGVNCQIVNANMTSVTVANANTSNTAVGPNMGLVVGHIKDGSLSGYTFEECVADKGRSTQNNRVFCGTYQEYGWLDNSTLTFS